MESSPAAISAAQDEAVRHRAHIESVQARISPDQPRTATVTIHGLLHDGATRIHKIEQKTEGGEVIVTVSTARARYAIASVALIPFERTINVDLSGLPSGPCRLRVNNVTATFTVP